MTTRRDPDARISAFFAQPQAELPDRTYDAVRREIHRARRRVVVGPFVVPSLRPYSRGGFAAVVAAVALVAVTLGIAIGPGGQHAPLVSPTPAAPTPAGQTPAPSGRPAASGGPAASLGASPAGPFTYTSAVYGYSVDVPAGWQARPATVHWTGIIQPAFGEVDVDTFTGPDELTLSGFAGSTTLDLPALVADRIAANARDHADTCPENAFQGQEAIEVGGHPGAVLLWNCGALINQAITIVDGTAYIFAIRDLSIEVATDPDDRALFQAFLDSVVLPTPAPSS